MHSASEADLLYGVAAEFESSQQLVDAAKSARSAGYRKIEAYSPVPIEELDEVLELSDYRVSLFTLLAGLTGCATGFSLIYWTSAISYPLNIGGRPLNSLPMDIPIMFELTILFAGLTAAIGMLVLNGLPMPYHPMFNVDRFALASRNRFFLCIRSLDPKFDRRATAHFLETLEPEEVAEVAQ